MPLGTVCDILLLLIKVSLYKLPTIDIACKLTTSKYGLSLSRLLKDEFQYLATPWQVAIPGKLVHPQRLCCLRTKLITGQSKAITTALLIRSHTGI